MQLASRVSRSEIGEWTASRKEFVPSIAKLLMTFLLLPLEGDYQLLLPRAQSGLGLGTLEDKLSRSKPTNFGFTRFVIVAGPG